MIVYWYSAYSGCWNNFFMWWSNIVKQMDNVLKIIRNE